MLQNKRTKNKFFTLLIGIMILVVVLGFCDGTIAAKMNVTKQANSSIATSMVPGVTIDNTTLDYPIEYQIGSVARNISVTTYCRTNQYVRVKIEMRYVSINPTTGACTLKSELTTENVNIVPFLGSDWYLYNDGTNLWAYLCTPFTADSTLGKSTSTLLTGVEFFAVDNGSDYSGLSLQFKFTSDTSFSAFSDAPAVWTRRIGGSSALYNSSGASGYGSATVYNSRTTDNMIAFGSSSYSGIGTHRTPTYIKNDSGVPVGLTFKLDIKWYRNDGTINDDLPINRIKVNLSGNKFNAYNSADTSSTSSNSLYTIVGTTATEADQLQYTTGVYFYKVEVAPYQTISVVDSVEIINYNWTAQDNSAFANHHVTVELYDVKTFAINTSDEDVKSVIGLSTEEIETVNLNNWASNLAAAQTAYHQVSYGMVNMIDITNASSSITVSTPSTIISDTNNMTIEVTYNIYVVAWVQFISSAGSSAENYDIVAGEYMVTDVTNSGIVTVRVDGGWQPGEESKYVYGFDSTKGILGKDRAVQFYSEISITNPNNLKTAIDNPYPPTIQTSGTGSATVATPGEYSPNYLLMVVPTITVATTGGSTEKDCAGEALISNSNVTINANSVNSYAVAVKNTSNLVYTSVELSLAVVGTVSFYGMNTGWSRSGNTFTYSSAVQPGQTIVAVCSIKGTSGESLTFDAEVIFSTPSSATNQTVDIVNETSVKGIYNNDSSSTGVNYNGDSASSTKVVRITNTSTDILYVKVALTFKYVKADTTLTRTTTLSAGSSWASNGTTHYYKGMLVPGATITIGGSYTIGTLTDLLGSTLLFEPTVTTAVVDTSASEFAAPSGWTYTDWTADMKDTFEDYFKYTYSA